MNPVQGRKNTRLTVTKAIVPLFSLGLLFVFWRMGLKWMTAPILLFLALFYFVLPALIRSRLERFNREALKLLTTGKASEIPTLVRKNIILQLFGPREPIDAKLALAYAISGDYHRALPCYENAIRDASVHEKPALQAGLVKALFVTGDLARAEAEGRAMTDRVARLPETLAIMARARIGLNKLDDTTRSLLDEAEKISPNADVTLMTSLSRIELALASGRKPPQLPDSADSDQRFIRAWVQLVRGLLREKRGATENALKSFSKASSMAKDSFISAVAKNHLDTNDSDTTDAVSNSGGHDPAVRRKKKKRR
jgi:tetratricopeptide (TPR) repeat protein